MFRYFVIPVFTYSCISVFQYLHIPIFQYFNIGMSLYSNTAIFLYPSIPIFPQFNLPIFQYSYFSIFQYSRIPIFRHSHLLLQKPPQNSRVPSTFRQREIPPVIAEHPHLPRIRQNPNSWNSTGLEEETTTRDSQNSSDFPSFRQERGGPSALPDPLEGTPQNPAAGAPGGAAGRIWDVRAVLFHVGFPSHLLEFPAERPRGGEFFWGGRGWARRLFRS